MKKKIALSKSKRDKLIDDITIKKQRKIVPPSSKRKIILDKGQAPGDILVFTGAVRDLKTQFPDWEIDVHTPCGAIYENNPHLTPGLKKTSPGVEFYDVGYSDVDNSGWSGRHFSNAYIIELENILGVKIKQNSLLPDLHISDEEKGWINQVEETFGYRGSFWIINAGNKDDYPLKQWGFENWQEMVNLLKNTIQFVQVGEVSAGHSHPELKNVLSLVGETDLRQMIRLGYHAAGTVCHVTFHMHLAAAFKKPCVVIAGGREPRRWEMYPNHRYMDTNGCMECCSYNGCWQNGYRDTYDESTQTNENKSCKNLVGCKPKCMQMIKPRQVTEEIMNYYIGGMLKF